MRFLRASSDKCVGRWTAGGSSTRCHPSSSSESDAINSQLRFHAFKTFYDFSGICSLTVSCMYNATSDLHHNSSHPHYPPPPTCSNLPSTGSVLLAFANPIQILCLLSMIIALLPSGWCSKFSFGQSANLWCYVCFQLNYIIGPKLWP